MSANPDIEQILVDQYARQQPPKRLPPVAAMQREFRALGDDRYQMTIVNIGVTLEIDRLRRERHALMGELSVSCTLPGAFTFDNSLSIADFNVSSAWEREKRIKLLALRANTRGSVDWFSIVEEFCQRVLRADREGEGAVVLGEPDPNYKQEAMIDIDRLIIPRNHPTILFGDGGTCKSYIALRLLGKLAEQGMNVLYLDWEFDRQVHEYRLAELFPDGIPQVFYLRCYRPLIHEVDGIVRVARQNDVRFIVYDSIAYACAGPPEAAEGASAYFRAANQVGIGSLHIAHVNKSEQGDRKPFGSVFWHNSARCTWHIAADEDSENPKQVALYNRKANMGKLARPVSYTIRFTEYETIDFRLADIGESPGLSGKLSIRERMHQLLKYGALSYEAIAEDIGADVSTVRTYATRHKKQFVLLQGGKVGLAAN